MLDVALARFPDSLFLKEQNHGEEKLHLDVGIAIGFFGNDAGCEEIDWECD